MLHEILLSLSGHPSPLLRTGNPTSHDVPSISPAEKDLLATAAQLSDLHVKLLSCCGQICASHPSIICRAVATTIQSAHLTAFQQKVLEVERSILQKDSALVGAYNIVPLTAVIAEFSPWSRPLQWLWSIAQFMSKAKDGKPCVGSCLIDRLRAEMQTGYADIEQLAVSLVRSAETAWLKQVAAWVLYGTVPSFGEDDFFIQRSEDRGYLCVPELLPSFVTTSMASSMLFIGKSLNHIRVKSTIESGLRGRDHLAGQLQELSGLKHPLDSASFSKAIATIRLSLFRSTLQKLLPLAKVIETLQLFRDFFLLGRGEFAMALTHEADEKNRNRWRRADNLAYEKPLGLGNVVVKQGEVARVLARTWAAMNSMQGLHADEDEGLELARDMLRLQLIKSKQPMPLTLGQDPSGRPSITLPVTPFQNLLFSVPVILNLPDIPSPLDMFLTPLDLQIYSTINSYLLCIRRAHIRLTDLWKISSFRRHHPAPPGPPIGSARGGRAKVLLLRERYTSRSSTMRSAWVTCSAAVFFLAETEAYLQSEVVAVLWDDFHTWLTGSRHGNEPDTSSSPSPPNMSDPEVDDDDIWLAPSKTASTTEPSRDSTPPAANHPPSHRQHDPESLSTAHRTYLHALAHRLLLTQPSYTDPLYALLLHIDHLVALIHRLHAIWTSMDLEADAGVVDAFVDLDSDEADVQTSLRRVERDVKRGVEEVVAALRALETDVQFMADLDGDAGVAGRGDGGRDEETYGPRRVGGINRLLMKLDFGGWFGGRGGE